MNPLEKAKLVQRLRESHNKRVDDMFDSIAPLSPLQKAKLVKNLKDAIAEAKTLTGLSKAKAVKQIVDIRKQLGLTGKPADPVEPEPIPEPTPAIEPSDKYPQLSAMEQELTLSNYKSLDFEAKYSHTFTKMARKLAGDGDALKRLEAVLDAQTDNLVLDVTHTLSDSEAA